MSSGFSADPSPKTSTPFHQACEAISQTPLEQFEEFIQNKVDFELPDSRGHSPLHYALTNATQHDENKLTFLLSQDCVDVNKKDQNDMTLVHTICNDKINQFSLTFFKFLIEEKRANLSVKNRTNRTPIHYALVHYRHNDGDSNVLKYLLEQDVEVNNVGAPGLSLLHAACSNIPHVPIEIFKLLIEEKTADITQQPDSWKHSPLHLALTYFTHDSDINTVMYLLSFDNTDVNVKDREAQTPIHRACININKFHLPLFKALIDVKGGSLTAKDSYGDSPIHLALEKFESESGDIEVIKYLLSHESVDANQEGSRKNNLLRKACYGIVHFPLETFKILIESKNANVNHVDFDGYTPIHYALRNYSTCVDKDIILYLLKCEGVDVNTPGQYGPNLAETASKNPQIPQEILKYMVDELGADAAILRV